MPPAPGLAGHTIRQMIHVSLGGDALRFRVSNEYGDAPLRIEALMVARVSGRGTIDPASSVMVRFRGDSTVLLEPGAFAFSDDVAMPVEALSDLMVTALLGPVPAALTGHPGSRTSSFIVDGNHVRDAELAGAVVAEHWYVLTSADVHRGGAGGAAVVVLGNSIADGRGSGTDRNDRWPDNLARRLASSSGTGDIGVANAGIGGNTILKGGLGPTALARFERDVLDQRGARWLIVSEGVNDIGGARGADSSASTARQLIEAYGQMIARAHARGLKVFGATILPFGGSQYGSPDHEAARQAVNRFIREGGAFDAVLDLDAVMRDPSNTDHLRKDVDSGDHLHPNEAGYRAMADAIDLRLFERR